MMFLKKYTPKIPTLAFGTGGIFLAPIYVLKEKM
jgi:hypothetical protein